MSDKKKDQDRADRFRWRPEDIVVTEDDERPAKKDKK